MGLSYYYEFTASADTTADTLEAFLHEVESVAKSLGFAPTVVLNVPFDTPERQQFSRQLGSSYTVHDERLKGLAIPAVGQLRDHDPILGECRLFPKHGVVMVVTNEQGFESSFGFFKFSEQVIDIHGRILADTGLEGRWWFRDFVDSPDPRYRTIARYFEQAGYLKSVKDQYV